MDTVDWYKRACELAELYGRALANLETHTYVWDSYDDQDLRQFTEDAARDLDRHKAKPSVWGADGIKLRAEVYQRYLNESHRRAEKLNGSPEEAGC
jgi:hypothetical protein